MGFKLEFGPVQFPVLDQASPRLDRTGLRSFLDRCQSVLGIFDILCLYVAEKVVRLCGKLQNAVHACIGRYCLSD